MGPGRTPAPGKGRDRDRGSWEPSPSATAACRSTHGNPCRLGRVPRRRGPGGEASSPGIDLVRSAAHRPRELLLVEAVRRRPGPREGEGKVLGRSRECVRGLGFFTRVRGRGRNGGAGAWTEGGARVGWFGGQVGLGAWKNVATQGGQMVTVGVGTEWEYTFFLSRAERIVSLLSPSVKSTFDSVSSEGVTVTG
jgi:hypothetical protein